MRNEKHRNQFEIIYEILKYISEKGQTTLKYKFMIKNNLSYEMIKKYSEVLIKNNLVKRTDFYEYKITEKGIKYLQTYRTLRHLINAE